MKKRIPELFEKKEDCCGCTACYSICPRRAICMIDEDGFDYPAINPKMCIGCNKCIEVCPIKKSKNKKGRNKNS